MHVERGRRVRAEADVERVAEGKLARKPIMTFQAWPTKAK